MSPTPASGITAIQFAAAGAPAAEPHLVVVDEAPTTDDFDTFFAVTYPGLVRALTFALGSSALADDCVQEAFCRAYARWGRIRRYDDPAGWVRRVAINRGRDLLRSDRRRRRVEEAAAAAEGVDPRPAEALPQAIAEALAEIPPQQRMAIALHYLADLPVRDVATALGVSDGAVKYHLHSGRARLAPLLTDEES